MNIRQAILKAADSVEQEGMYRFMAQKVSSCRTPMCMWGWIGFHLGMPKGTHVEDVPEKIGVEGDHALYEHRKPKFGGFTTDPKIAAALMRSFADDKFPA